MRSVRCLLILIFLLGTGGCAARIERLQHGMLRQDDPLLVEAGLPGYLIVLDGLVEAFPDQRRYVQLAVDLNTVYGSLMLHCGQPERAVLNYMKARDYGQRLLKEQNPDYAESASLADLQTALHGFGQSEQDLLFSTSQAWLFWVMATDSWSARADLPQIEAMLLRVLALDHDHVLALAMLGALYMSRPAQLGGRPGAAELLFRRASQLNEGQNLMVELVFAQYYARGVYDRGLHDELLGRILSSDPLALPDEHRLANRLAIIEAAKLMESADEYF